MRRDTVIAALAGAMAASGAASPAQSQSPQSLVSTGVSAPWKQRAEDMGPNPVQGRFVALGGEFGELSYACVSCHQLDGAGDRSGAFPRLTGQSAWYLFHSLQSFASGERHSDVMSPIARELTEQDMLNVAVYYASVGHQPYPPALPPRNGRLLEQGRQIALTGFPTQGVLPCVSCHGAQGEGEAPLFPFLGGQYGPYLEQQLRMFKKGERSGGALNVMTTIADGLSDQQIQAVSAYFASLTPEQVTPQSRPRQNAAEQRPVRTEKPHLGAAMHPMPESGDVVVPGASTAR